MVTNSRFCILRDDRTLIPICDALLQREFRYRVWKVDFNLSHVNNKANMGPSAKATGTTVDSLPGNLLIISLALRKLGRIVKASELHVHACSQMDLKCLGSAPVGALIQALTLQLCHASFRQSKSQSC